MPRPANLLVLTKRLREYHKKSAADCFNRAWDYLDMKHRTDEDNRQMLGLAHASLYHWGVVGSPRERAVGEWQVSRVYSAMGQGALALLYAKSCLETCERNHLSDITHTASEAVARAYAVAGEFEKATRQVEKARTQLGKLTLSSEDRKIYTNQLRDTQALIRKLSTNAAENAATPK